MGKNKAFANLVLVNDKEGVKRAFISNFDLAPQLAYRFYKMYSKLNMKFTVGLDSF